MVHKTTMQLEFECDPPIRRRRGIDELPFHSDRHDPVRSNGLDDDNKRSCRSLKKMTFAVGISMVMFVAGLLVQENKYSNGPCKVSRGDVKADSPYRVVKMGQDFSVLENLTSSHHDMLPVNNVSMPIQINETRDSTGTGTEEKSDCEYISPDWQDSSFPTCNILHEADIIDGLTRSGDGAKILGIGGKRIAWKVPNGEEETFVLKTVRYEKEISPNTFKMKIRDAVATERLTFSPHVMNVYGYCGGSVLNQIGEEGADEFFKKNDPSSKEKLRYARDAAQAVADVHSIRNRGNVTTLAHGDVRPWNFIMTDGGSRIMLHDFDEAHFLTWRKDTGEVCGTGHFACNRNRAPEECSHNQKKTEKIDVYALGNFMFFILMKDLPYTNLLTDPDTNKEMVLKGIAPPLREDLKYSEDKAIVAMREAMKKCHVLDQDERGSAREIAHDLGIAYASL